MDHVTRMGEITNAHKVSVRKPKGKRSHLEDQGVADWRKILN